MNAVRERILREVAYFGYKGFEKHKDFIAFCVSDECFCYNPDTDKEEESDFCEIIVIVERDWLFNLIKKENGFKSNKEARRFLQEEYTSEDSKEWYDLALLENKIVMVSFN